MSDFAPKCSVEPDRGESAQRAILVHGPFQSAPETSASLHRYVTGAGRAPIFHFGPYRSHASKATPFLPSTDHQTPGLAEIPVHTSRLLDRYGRHLKGHELHHIPASRFIEDARALVPEIRRLPGADPADLLARIYNMEGAIGLLQTWEKGDREQVNQVVLVRSDLAFYSPIGTDIPVGYIGIATAEGFSQTTGDPNTQALPLRYFRNRETGDFVLGGSRQSFNSDIIVVNRVDLDCFKGLYQKAIDLLAEGAPPHLETILYLIFVGRRGLKTRSHSRWLYEICRRDEPTIVAVSDHKESISDGHLALVPQHAVARASTDGKHKRVAVLLYGLLRDYATTVGSITEHVIKPNNAAVFYYGPAQTDRPTRKHGGSFDEQGFFLSNPKGNFDTLQSLEETDVKRVYGTSLKSAEFHSTSQEHFLKLSENIFPREEWMFMLSPHRLLSMFYNMNGVVRLLRKYENEVGYAFDEIVITRPDLAFYTPITPHVKSGELHIAGSEGFDINGHEHQGNAPVYFYKNVLTGEYTPAGRRLTFNDQVFVLKRENLVHFYDIYEQLVCALKNKVPCSPETIFYLLLIQKAGLSLVSHPEWAHEIYRADDPVIKGVNDTPDILHIDPHSPKAARFRPLEPHNGHSDKPRETPSDSVSQADDPTDRHGLASIEDNIGLLRDLGTTHEVPPDPMGQISLIPTTLKESGVGLLRDLLQTNGEPGWWSTMQSRLLLAKARKERRAGNVLAAEHYYARVLRLTPSLQREWVQYGHALKDQGEWRAAIGAYEFALLLKPDDQDAALHHRSAVHHVSITG